MVRHITERAGWRDAQGGGWLRRGLVRGHPCDHTGMILHITNRAAWRDAQAAGWYRPASLHDEGFIHCSTAAQLVATADRFYLGRSGLVVLVIDEAQVMSPLRYEAPV